jgi:hypothetical protein
MKDIHKAQSFASILNGANIAIKIRMRVILGMITRESYTKDAGTKGGTGS